jgi:uncharacterized membrane protein
MSETVHERIRIEADVDHCLAVVLNFEAYPEWARDLKKVTVLERDAEGRGISVEYRAAAMGKSVTYVLTYDYSALPERLSWVLDHGDSLRSLDGTYRFESDGPATRVHYDLAVEISVPLPGLIKRRAAGMITGTALKDLKRAAESE